MSLPAPRPPGGGGIGLGWLLLFVAMGKNLLGVNADSISKRTRLVRLCLIRLFQRNSTCWDGS